MASILLVYRLHFESWFYVGIWFHSISQFRFEARFESASQLHDSWLYSRDFRFTVTWCIFFVANPKLNCYSISPNPGNSSLMSNPRFFSVPDWFWIPVLFQFLVFLEFRFHIELQFYLKSWLDVEFNRFYSSAGYQRRPIGSRTAHWKWRGASKAVENSLHPKATHNRAK